MVRNSHYKRFKLSNSRTSIDGNAEKQEKTNKHRRTCRNTLGADFLRDLLQGITHFLLRGRALPVWVEGRTSLLTGLPAAGLFGIGTDLSASKYTPGSKCKTLRTRHRDDIALERPLEYRPVTLINAEWGFSVVLCVLIRFGNDPRGSIRDALEKRIMKLG